MVENELKHNIAQNIASLRKKSNMTQAELAEKLSYSDKSISKWERGDGLPDVLVLTQIADLFGVTVNDIIGSAAADIPEKKKTVYDTANPRKMLITALSTGLVWFVAALIFFFFRIFMPETKVIWIIFIYALSVSSVVLVVFSHLWWGTVSRCLSVSSLLWSVSACIHLTIDICVEIRNIHIIYVAAGFFQGLVVLWYLYIYFRKKNHKKVNSSVNDGTVHTESVNESAAQDTDDKPEE